MGLGSGISSRGVCLVGFGRVGWGWGGGERMDCVRELGGAGVGEAQKGLASAW